MVGFFRRYSQSSSRRHRSPALLACSRAPYPPRTLDSSTTCLALSLRPGPTVEFCCHPLDVGILSATSVFSLRTLPHPSIDSRMFAPLLWVPGRALSLPGKL